MENSNLEKEIKDSSLENSNNDSREEVSIDETEVNKENESIIEDTKIELIDLSKVQVVSKEWTVETIFSQIQQEHIDLNPKFQRRNAWNDVRRNQLIESLIVGFPIPEIVLAENPNKRRLYVVIDGKQRLSAISGFMEPEKFPFWQKPILKGLKIRTDLNGLTFKELQENPEYEDSYRQFMNASTRCTIIVTDFESNNDILYHIFYRLNTSSVQLATQELRQVLFRGDFANYLIEITEEKQPIHRIMGISGPDKRLSDVEIILKFISIVLFGATYKSNLKKFLDESMDSINKKWDSIYSNKVKTIYRSFNKGIENLENVYKSPNAIGRKNSFKGRSTRLNRNYFETLVFYFRLLDNEVFTDENNIKFLTNIDTLLEDPVFLNTIESNTKPLDNYKLRYAKVQDVINRSFGTSINETPF